MPDIKVGAEVTLIGKVLEISEGDPKYAHRHRVAFPTGLILWLPANVFSTVKNQKHPEPASGYAVVDGQIAWRNPGHDAGWETDSSVYRDGWDELFDRLDPIEVVELVRKDAA